MNYSSGTHFVKYWGGGGDNLGCHHTTIRLPLVAGKFQSWPYSFVFVIEILGLAFRTIVTHLRNHKVRIYNLTDLYTIRLSVTRQRAPKPIFQSRKRGSIAKTVLSGRVYYVFVLTSSQTCSN